MSGRRKDGITTRNIIGCLTSYVRLAMHVKRNLLFSGGGIIVGCVVRSFVDDLRLRAHHQSEQEAAKRAAWGLADLIPKLRALKCQVSEAKTLLLGSSANVRLMLANLVRLAFLYIPAASV